jgi:hypothetical protein
MKDVFDPENLRLTPEQAATIGMKVKGARQRKRTKRTMDPFVKVPIGSLVAGSGVLRGTKQVLVWIYLHHKVWKDGNATVKIANQTLESWGVGRKEKYKALHSLKEAGLISIERRPRRSPLVTILTRV